MSTTEIVWLAVGFSGQLLFTARFLVQWLASERKGESVVPVAFWHLGIGGSALLLLYATYRRDPVIILGQMMGVVIYSRNLVLIARKQKAAALQATEVLPVVIDTSDETAIIPIRTALPNRKKAG